MSSTHISEKASAPRQGLYDLADDLFKEFEEKNNLLANVHGIRGMGATKFLKEVFIPLLDSNGITHTELIQIPALDATNAVVEKSKYIAEWIYSNLLKVKHKKRMLYDVDELEKRYIELREELEKKKDKHPFAILIDNISNLPFDDLDWFQSVVLETVSSWPGSIVVLTSQNELNWHSWEMRNRCVSRALPRYSEKEILELCGSRALAKKIMELSVGHPKTVQALVNVAQQHKKELSSLMEKDIDGLIENFFVVLGNEIDANLVFGDGNGWLKEIFYLASAADGFDADLIGDLASAFKDQIFKDKNALPTDVTDIAWEMAYTGLVTWDFDEKAYKIAPELRGRIAKYMEYERREDFTKALETIAKSYLLRHEILPEWDIQMINFMIYMARANRLQGVKGDIQDDIISGLKPRLSKTDDSKRLLSAIDKNKNLLFELGLKRTIEFINNMIVSPEVENESQNEEETVETTPITTQEPRKGFTIFYLQRKEEEDFRNLLDGKSGNSWILALHGEAGLGKSFLLRKFRSIAKDEKGFPVVLIDLHFRQNRRRAVFLQKIKDQLNINDRELQAKINILRDPNVYYSAITPTEAFETASHEAVLSTIAALSKLKEKAQKRVVLLLDTFDKESSIDYLAKWLIRDLILPLKDSIFFVIAGRRTLGDSLSLESFQLHEIDSQPLSEFTNPEIGKIVKYYNKNLDNKTKDRIVVLAKGNPLIASWLAFSTESIDIEKELFSSENRDKVLNLIAEKIWGTHEMNKPIVKTFKAAVHFGQEFNLDLFEKVINKSDLYGKRHRDMLEYLKQNFPVYGRTPDEVWTLHDDIRHRMFEALKRSQGASNTMPKTATAELAKLSANAVKYYDERVQRLDAQRKEIGLTPDEQADFYDYKAEKIYHSLYEDSLSHHLDLWNFLDELWHGYKLSEMAQTIQYARDVQERNRNSSEDSVLNYLIMAADAWLHHSQDDFDTAEKYANEVRLGTPPRRLLATALVVLGLSPIIDPQTANNYLEKADELYKELQKELEGGKEIREFIDSLDDILQERHLVLMSKGRSHIQHFFDLSDGEKDLEDAYNLFANPLFKAVALNEIARIKRFKGQFEDAIQNVTQAISIYNREFSKRNEDPNLDLNYANFFKTLGLIYKEQQRYKEAIDMFNSVLEMYENILGLPDTYAAAVKIEIAHIYILTGERAFAEPLLRYALSVFEPRKETNVWNYLNVLNKFGEMYVFNDTNQAENYFRKELEFAQKRGYDLWAYWAALHLSEIEFNKTGSTSTGYLKDLLVEYDEKRHRDLGPAFWNTKLLLSKIAEKEQDVSEELIQMAEGLAYLAPTWKSLFDQCFSTFTAKFMSPKIPAEVKVEAAKSLKKWWRNKFTKDDPAPIFVQFCENIIESN